MRTLVCLALVLSFSIAADGASSGRKFYLANDPEEGFHGDQPLTACASGYHMASLYEIFDPSGLVYNAKLGFTWPEGDGAPPTGIDGWIRTGSHAAHNDLGSASPNCDLWTTTEGYGTTVELDQLWGPPATMPSTPWVAAVLPCTLPRYVWCVED